MFEKCEEIRKLKQSKKLSTHQVASSNALHIPQSCLFYSVEDNYNGQDLILELEVQISSQHFGRFFSIMLINI